MKKEVVHRMEAEQKYGFRIYQGGVVPEEKLRILESLSAASSGIEEKPLEVSEKEEILKMIKTLEEGEKPLSIEEKLDILESLRKAE